MVRAPRSLLLLSTLALVAAPACARPPAPLAPPPSCPPSVAAPASPPAPPRAEPASAYDKPPAPLLEALHAPSPPSPHVSPTGDRILLEAWVDYPPIARVAEPFLRLAGVRLEPRTRRRHDTQGGYGIPRCLRSLTIVTPDTGTNVQVSLPPGGCAAATSWSPDGRRFSFTNGGPDAVELWVGDARTGEARAIPGARLNPMFGSTVQWLGARGTLLVKLVSDGAGPPPAAPAVPPGPSIQETDGKRGESSTYEARDTLTGKHDEDLFDYYGTSQLATVDAGTGAVIRIGRPGMYTGLDGAPDGEHVLVTTLRRPYSYATTYERFPKDVEVWDRSGAIVKRLASLPLADRVPVHGVPVGPRGHEWRQNEPATVVWAEALDGGDWNTKVPRRDAVMMQRAPFRAAPVEIARTEQRYSGLHWGERGGLALLHEYDDNRHWRRAFVVDVDAPTKAPRVLWDLSSDEHYADPGAPVMRALPNGAWVMRQDAGAIFLSGAGSSPDGDRPFLDRLELAAGKAERLFRSEKTAYERFLAFAGADHRVFYTWHQSVVDPPNAFVRTLGAARPAPAGEAAVLSTSRPITHIPDPTLAARRIQKRLVKYKRKDGTDLSFTLYTPPDYVEGTRVPAILYAYPLDYADASKAAQVKGSEHTFTRLRWHRLLLLAGYAIIDDASFPIVGDPKKAYDTYLEQLVDDAQAAVDEAVRLGVVDRDRIGVTGHSHGALMTANLLAHSDLFRAGVATSGSYNKTFTSFGFQNERRSVWEAQGVYLRVSPYFFADKLKLPLLIMHGGDDANPGTTPLQSQKLYEALRGNGGTARLVMLPHEPHWYSAMESNEQLVAEMVRWFDRYVKSAPPRATRR
jgi:dipeptidyl aminopeptidase/acylaminoacyl peptidase